MRLLAILIIALFISLPSWAQMNKGIDALNSEMYTTAKSCFINQLRDSLTRPLVCYYLGKLYHQTGNNDSAMICYNMGIDCSTPNALCMIGKAGLLMAEDPDKASLLIREANSAKGYKKNPALQVAIANVYSDNDRYGEANELLKLAAEKDAKYSDIYFAEGNILVKQKKISDAANKYETAIYYDTLCKPAYLKIARIYYLAKYYDQSLSYIEKLKGIDPHYPAAIKLLGDIYYDQGKYSGAVSSYAEYLQTPEAGINDRIRYAYALFFNKEFEKSLDWIKQLVPQNPGNQFLKRIMAYNSYEIGNYSDGLNQMEDFLNVSDPSIILPSDYKYYARLLSKNNRDSLSAINYQKAIALSDDPKEYYKEVALLYERMKQYNNAAIFFENHMKTTTNPANSDLFFWGKDCYFAAGTIDSTAIANDSSQALVRRKLYEKADSIFKLVTTASPNNYLGSFWRARVNSVLDPDTELGLAKPYYERVIELLDQPGKNNKKELIEAYQYLGYYFYLKNDLTNSKLYWKKILEIDPDHMVAKQAIKGIK
jgi:tetratricopeptide (TPR) repeat protein